MENVEAAPVPNVQGYAVSDVLIRDHWVGGETSRLRRFSFGTTDGRALPIKTLALHRPDPDVAALASSGGRRRPVAIGGSGKRKYSGGDIKKGRYDWAEHCRLQGLPADF